MGFFGGSRRKHKTARKTVSRRQCDKRGQDACLSQSDYCMWTKPGKRKSFCRRKKLR